MKKNFVLFTVLCLLALTVKAQFGGGYGRPLEPYIINTAEHLDSIRYFSEDENLHFKLGATIEYPEFETIENFKGTFDGNKKWLTLNKPFVKNNYGTIKKLGILIEYDGDGPENVGEENFGVIACNQYYGGEINNCMVYGHIKNAGTGIIGGIVGSNSGTITYCHSYVNIRSEGTFVGGIAGYNSYDFGGPASINNCYVHGTIIGKKNVGGILGGNSNYAIDVCGSYSMVYGEENVGGVVGNHQGGYIVSSYAQGIVKGKKNIGGIVGYSNNTNTSNRTSLLNLCYTAAIVDNTEMEAHEWNWITAGLVVGYVESYAVEVLSPIYADRYINRDYVDQQIIGHGSYSGSILVMNHPTALMAIGFDGPYSPYYPANQSKEYPFHYHLIETGDKPSTLYLKITLDRTDWQTPLVKWECFGLEKYMDWGELVLRGLDENYKTCDMFEIPVPCYAGSGTAEDPYQISTPEQLDWMMDYLTENNGTVEHFRIMNDIDMESYLMENYPAAGWRGNEVADFNGYLHGGGHVISGIWMNHTLSDTIGGLLAGTGGNAVIDSLGIMFSSRGLYAKGAAGGLVGYNAGVINSCFATGGNIITLNDPHGTGGLVGINQGTIQNSYTTCNVIAATSNYAGGVAGYNHSTGIIMYTYAAGVVTGSYSGYIGGVVGMNNTGRVRSNYYDTQKTLQSNGIGLDVSGTEERYTFGNTTAQMKDESEMYQLDFINIWKLIPNYYPMLRWQETATAPYSLLLPAEFVEEFDNSGLNTPVKIYPNPTTGIVYIETAEQNPEISLYDLNGAVIFKTNQQTIDITSYPKGMYILNINGKMEKLIKQ